VSASAEPSGGGPVPTGVTASEGETDGETDEGFDDEPAVPEAMNTREESVERQATPEVPLDHRLPEPAEHREEPRPSLTSARDDSDPGTSEG
jgi:hypothetical protein